MSRKILAIEYSFLKKYYGGWCTTVVMSRQQAWPASSNIRQTVCTTKLAKYAGSKTSQGAARGKGGKRGDVITSPQKTIKKPIGIHAAGEL